MNINETSRRQKAVSILHGVSRNVRTFCIITANNPMWAHVNGNDTLSNEENNRLNNEFEKFIREHAFRFFKVIGRYNSSEKSYIIYNVPLNFCMILGKNFDQRSFIYADINHDDANVKFQLYTKLESAKSDAIEKDKEYFLEEEISQMEEVDVDTEDYYTGIGKKFKFTVPFNVFNESFHEGCTEIDRLVENRKENFPKYNRLFEEMMMFCIAPKGNYRNQRFARAFLYGDHFQKMLKD